MRLVFAHDHRFYTGPNGLFYSAGPFPTEAWARYLRHFDEVEVVGRDGGSISDVSQMTQSSTRGVHFHLFPSLASPRQLLFRSRQTNAAMRTLVESADAVVARLPSEMGFLAIAAAKQLGVVYAVEVVGCAWDSYRTNGARGARLYAPLAYLRTRRAVADAPLALYVTSSWLQRRYPTSGLSVSASNVLIRSMDAAGERRRKSRLAEVSRGRPPLLGTIGTLRNKYKGIQTAMEALARLRSSGLDLTYKILGPGAIEPWQRLAANLGIADVVHFDGTRSAGGAVHAWLDDIDIYLQPSFTEGMPKSTIEAMSRGAACIGSKCGGIPELLPEDRLHEPRDAAALAAIIRRLASDPSAIAEASATDIEGARQFDPAVLDAQRNRIFGSLKACAEEQRRLHSRSGMAWSA